MSIKRVSLYMEIVNLIFNIIIGVWTVFVLLIIIYAGWPEASPIIGSIIFGYFGWHILGGYLGLALGVAIALTLIYYWPVDASDFD